MIFNKHLNLVGKHAFLSASKYHWLNYTDENLLESYQHSYAAPIGTALHDLAKSLIKYKIKLKQSDKSIVLLKLLDSGIPGQVIDVDAYFTNFMTYVNDAIKYRMDPEVILFHSDNCFGCADSISFRNNLLRIHDLKTGEGKTHMEQLLIYAALFCLEYKIKPEDITFELRIYQSSEVLCHTPASSDVNEIMERIIYCNNEIDRMTKEVM